MRYVFAALALLMGLFVLVQYNDPDGPLWMVFYGVPAVFAGIAWRRPQLLAGTAALALLAAAAVAGLVLVVVLWPPAEQWWHSKVWWNSEASREGMGLMIAAGVLLAVLSTSLRLRSRAAAGHN
jgi:hypothetical protein